MSMKSIAVAALGLVLMSGAAQAGWWPGAKGNDTGGIIPWRPVPDTMILAREYAQAECAYWGKVARITSARRVPGDFIAYECRFDRRPAYGW